MPGSCLRQTRPHHHVPRDKANNRLETGILVVPDELLRKLPSCQHAGMGREPLTATDTHLNDHLPDYGPTSIVRACTCPQDIRRGCVFQPLGTPTQSPPQASSATHSPRETMKRTRAKGTPETKYPTNAKNGLLFNAVLRETRSLRIKLGIFKVGEDKRARVIKRFCPIHKHQDVRRVNIPMPSTQRVSK